ncbi:MAG: hypothetical protein ACK5EO_06320, partial [Planctomycetota bacterium]
DAKLRLSANIVKRLSSAVFLPSLRGESEGPCKDAKLRLSANGWGQPLNNGQPSNNGQPLNNTAVEQ